MENVAILKVKQLGKEKKPGLQIAISLTIMRKNKK